MTVPDNMNDFVSQAQQFIKTAQEKGVDNVGIANTLNFMYDLTQKNIQNTKGTYAEQSQAGLQGAQSNLANAQATQYQTASVNPGDIPGLNTTGASNNSSLGSTPSINPLDGFASSWNAPAKPSKPSMTGQLQSIPTQPTSSNPNYPSQGLYQEAADWLGQNVKFGNSDPLIANTPTQKGLSIEW